MVVLRGEAVSYERGTPVTATELAGWRAQGVLVLASQDCMLTFDSCGLTFESRVLTSGVMG